MTPSASNGAVGSGCRCSCTCAPAARESWRTPSGARIALQVVEVLPHQELRSEARDIGSSHLRQGTIDLVLEDGERARGPREAARRHPVQRVAADEDELGAQA